MSLLDSRCDIAKTMLTTLSIHLHKSRAHKNTPGTATAVCTESGYLSCHSRDRSTHFAISRAKIAERLGAKRSTAFGVQTNTSHLGPTG
jgi:hypothetical protein